MGYLDEDKNIYYFCFLLDTQYYILDTFFSYLTKIFLYIIITTNVIVMVVITQITLKKVMQIPEGNMSFVEIYSSMERR